jgi:hypothetical protein
MIVINNVTRGRVDFTYDGRTGTIGGEGLLPGYSPVDYVLYENTFNKWNPPHETEFIDSELKNKILNEIVKLFLIKGMKAEIE